MERAKFGIFAKSVAMSYRRPSTTTSKRCFVSGGRAGSTSASLGAGGGDNRMANTANAPTPPAATLSTNASTGANNRRGAVTSRSAAPARFHGALGGRLTPHHARPRLDGAQHRDLNLQPARRGNRRAIELDQREAVEHAIVEGFYFGLDNLYALLEERA